MMFLAGICLFALALRLMSWPGVFSPDGVMFLDSDAMYHMRRVSLAVTHRLQLDSYDSYMNFPDGFHCNWPGFFDQFIAAIALVVGRGHPSPDLVDTVGAFVPPILGALTCIPIYACARIFLSQGYALGASAIFAVMPFHIQLSELGRPDHHVAVVFLASLLTGCALRIQSLKAPGTTIAMSLLLGILLYLSFMVWAGSMVFALILSLHGAVSILLALPEPARSHRMTLAATIPQCLAALLIAPIALRTYWAETGFPVWEALSAFHVEALACSGIGLAAFGIIARLLYVHRSNRAIFASAIVVLVGVMGFGGALALHSSLGQLYMEASHWVTHVDPFFRYGIEATPLSIYTASAYFTSLVFIFPVLVVWLVFRARLPEQYSQALLLALWVVVYGAVAIPQERFSDILCIFAPILVATFIAGWVRLSRIVISILTLRTSPVHVAIAGVVGVAILWLIFSPTITWIEAYSRVATHYTPAREYELGRWLASNTEPTSGFNDPTAYPDYGVLASRESGHVITAIGHRPNIANDFLGWNENHEANLAPYRFFIEQDPVRAMAILDRYKVRYVVTKEPLFSGELPRIVDVLGLASHRYFTREPATTRHGPVYNMTQDALDTMLIRLYTLNAAGLPAFSLVYESIEKVDVGGTQMGVFKIFRYTPPHPLESQI